MEAPRVASGHVVALRMFEVAYGIDLAHAEKLWARHAAIAASRSRLVGTPPKAMAFGVPPLAIPLGSVTLDLDGRSCGAAATARVFDFGVASLALRVPADDCAWAEFSALVNAVDHAVQAQQPWDAPLLRLRTVLADAMERPFDSPLEEDFLLGIVHRFDAPLSAAELLACADLASLLSGEQRPLSESARADLMRQRFSYFADDLVVLAWDRAFVYEPRGDSDVTDVLEIANAQLLEMRYYDELLDDELPRMYDLVAETRRGLNVFAARRFATLARRFYTLVAEVTELTEKVDNALQVTEDVYLARVYAAALDLFRVRTVQAAVDRKLAIVRDTYAALYDEASSARSELLEVTVVLLILVELVLAVLRHAG